MNRARLAAGLALAGLAGWWAQAGRRPVAKPAEPVRLRVDELCGCGHLGGIHDQDLGCTALAGDWWYCPCRRLRCRCPLTPPAAR